MSEWPPIIIVLITYRRLNLALRTIKCLKERLDYPNIGWHIADDGSGPDYVQRLVDEIGPTYAITVSDAARGGVGKSMNMGIQAALSRADLLLMVEDDWCLRERLDMRPVVQLFMEREDVGMVRFGYLSPYVSGKIISAANELWWLLDRLSDHYVFTGHPSLRHRRFHDAYGLYPEGLGPGQTEDAMCGIFDTGSGPEIVWPAWLHHRGVFEDIGSHASFKVTMEREGLTGEQAADLFAQRGLV